MNEVRARRIAWLLWLVVGVIGVANAWIVLSNGIVADYGGPTTDAISLALQATAVAPFVIASGLGALVVSRKPRHPIGWLLLGFSVAFATVMLSEAMFVANRFVTPESPTAAGWAAFAWNVLGMVGFLQLVWLLWLFPTGQALSRFWLVPLGITMAIMTLLVLAFAAIPGPMPEELAPGTPPIDNPLGLEALDGLSGQMATIQTILMIPVMLLTLVAVVARFVRSRGDERAQLKWLVFAAVVGIAGVFTWAAFGSAWGAVGELGFFVLLPAAVAIAMLKYRLYDIDRLISRTLSYAIVTAALGGMYLGLVLLFGLIVQPLNIESDLAVAGSVLVVAALFNPVRRRAQVLVDRRFNRARYDSERRVAAFADQLRDEVDLDALTNELAQVVGETMQPTQVSVYLHAVEGARS